MSRVGVELMEIEREVTEEMRDGDDEVKRIPPWTKQITVRGIVASVLIGVIYSVIVTKLNLTTGLVPNLNVSAALLAYVILQSWTKVLKKANFTCTPFTKQENTIIQTCAVACYSIAVGGNSLFVILYVFSMLMISNELKLRNGPTPITCLELKLSVVLADIYFI